MTIRARLLATYVALTALGMSLLAGYILWSFHEYYLRSALADLTARCAAVSESVADAMEQQRSPRVRLLVERYATEDRLNIRVFDADGNLMASSAPRLDHHFTNWLKVPGVQEGLDGETAAGVEDVPHSATDELYAVTPMVRGGKQLGVLRMSLRLEQFHRQFQSMMRAVLGSLLVTFALCTLISAWLARSIAAPIQAMCQFAVRMGGGHFGEKLEIRRGDELSQLALSLNVMSQRLASLDDERRAFLANVSHELRTPVSNVHVTLEALESGAQEEPELRERFIRTALEETARLSRLVQDLLELGRLEAGVVPLDRRSLNLDDLVNRCLMALETRMRNRALRVRTDVPSLAIRGDAERLMQALLNVLDNAIKFSPEDATLHLTARVDGNCAELRIRDEGAGIREADLPHVFEQFYTADPSRKRGGTGLGLAIARRIIQAHGGTIAAVPGRGGATFTVRLPLDSQPGHGAAGKTGIPLTKA